SFNNTVDILMPPFEMYSKVLSMSDDVLPLYFEVLTDVELEEVAAIRQAIASGSANPMDFKMRLAREIVAQFHSPADAPAAEAEWIKRFREREIPEDMPEHVLAAPTNIVDVMIASGLAASKSEARRLIDGGGVRVAGEKVSSYDMALSPGEPVVVQVGRRKFVRVR
ncbi:tyrosine--tRNA ligase, partial [Kouleothrix aurantiaca]